MAPTRRATSGGRHGGRPLYQAQWNDDVHHALHVLLTGERGGYYGDYQPPLPHLGRCLAEGFAFQGEWSAYRGGARGEPSADLPPTAFVGFLQNHDQIGNRALGERITALASPDAVRAATAVLLLSPAPPLLFMGEEWAAPEPFLFFSDLGPDLGPLVSEGRRREFARFPEFADPATRERIPDPQAESTFRRSSLDWSRARAAVHKDWLAFHQALLALRTREIAPLLAGRAGPGRLVEGPRRDRARGRLDVPDRHAAARRQPGRGPCSARRAGRGLGPPPLRARLAIAHWSALPPWSVAFYLAGARQPDEPPLESIASR